jgi:hypothetical protein
LPLPARIISHDELLVALHVQPAGAVIFTLFAPPPAGAVTDVVPSV